MSTTADILTRTNDDISNSLMEIDDEQINVFHQGFEKSFDKMQILIVAFLFFRNPVLNKSFDVLPEQVRLNKSNSVLDTTVELPNTNDVLEEKPSRKLFD